MKYVQDSWAYKKLSLFLLIKLGIEFGDDKVRNWLISLLISIFISVFVTQPLQVRKPEIKLILV